MPSPISSRSVAAMLARRAAQLPPSMQRALQQLRHAANVSTLLPASAHQQAILQAVVDLNGTVFCRQAETPDASLPPQQAALHDLYRSFGIRPYNLAQFESLLQRIAEVCAPALAVALGEVARHDYARNVLTLNEGLTREICRDALQQYGLAIDPFFSLLQQLRHHYAYLLARDVAQPVLAESGALTRAEADIATLSDLNTAFRNPLIAHKLNAAREIVREQRQTLIDDLCALPVPTAPGPEWTLSRLLLGYEKLKWLRGNAQTPAQHASRHTQVVEFAARVRQQYPELAAHFPERY